MVKLKKVVVTVLLGVFLTITGAGVMANGAGEPPLGDVKMIGETSPAGSTLISEDPSFVPFRGTVMYIREGEFDTGLKYVFVEREDGKTAYLVVSEKTYFATDNELVEGATVTGYFDENLPIIMIYPPQYSAVVIVVEPLEGSIKVDRFDENLLSLDKMLELNVGDETEVMLQDGTTVAGELEGRNLVVFYEMATDSIPALTTPEKIVILSEQSLPPIYSLPVDPDHYLPELEGMDLVVENRIIEAPEAYYNRDKKVMVPLRAIGEALGFNVGWDAERKLVMLGDSFTASIGKDAYVNMKFDESISLGAVPELIDGRTFVPLDFFRKVIPMNNAYVFEAQIVIDNNEKMY